MANQDKFTYFQYVKEMGYPVFVRFDEAEFGASIQNFLHKLGFRELKDKELSAQKVTMKRNHLARVLTIKEATPSIARQISQAQQTDRYGLESVFPRTGYNVYRYKDVAAMVYSLGSQEWEMGTFPNFGEPELDLPGRVVMNRFLSWALAPLGILGFFGVPVDEGIVILKAQHSLGEAVFFDIGAKKMITVDGIVPLRPRVKLIKLDPLLHDEKRRLNRDELLSFLSVHCTYFDYQGLSVAVRQLIQTLAGNYDGIIYPEENFRPRSNLGTRQG